MTRISQQEKTPLAKALEAHEHSVEEFAGLVNLNPTTVRDYANGVNKAYRRATHRAIRKGLAQLEAQEDASRLARFRAQMEATKEMPRWAV